MFGEISSQLTCGKLKLLKQSLLAFFTPTSSLIPLPPREPHTYLITFFLIWQLPPTHSHSSLLLLSKTISHPLSSLLPTTHTLPWGDRQLSVNRYQLIFRPLSCEFTCPLMPSFPWVLWRQKWTLVILLLWQNASFCWRSSNSHVSLSQLQRLHLNSQTHTHLYAQSHGVFLYWSCIIGMTGLWSKDLLLFKCKAKNKSQQA